MMDRKQQKTNALGIYLHIPFCVQKCRYCDFLSAPAAPGVRRQYIRCLEEEIAQFDAAEDYQVRSIFFGGGTPSILEGEEIAVLIEAIRKRFSIEEDTFSAAEITIECNPGTLSARKLKQLRECGINRLSLGLQSAKDQELKLLGRIHTWREFEENFCQARETGFTNINVDLMSALPGQTVKSWEYTLEKVLALAPEHISAYSLIIEEGTPFWEEYGQDDLRRSRGETPLLLPSEEEERAMYERTRERLEEAGLYRYEISNYARPGYESRHNCGYWQRIPYAGFGLGASSQLGRFRYKNTESLTDYLKGDYSKKEVLLLTKDNAIEETLYLGLRMTEGISLEQFQKEFGVSVEMVYPGLYGRLEKQGLIEKKNGKLRLTQFGMDVSNRVLAEFLFDE